jgi:hypothetical protein
VAATEAVDEEAATASPATTIAVATGVANEALNLASNVDATSEAKTIAITSTTTTTTNNHYYSSHYCTN